MNVKPGLTYGIAILLLFGFVFVFPPITSTESFSEALWETWGATIVIVSFVLFAGGAGILVLLGGGWRWE
jgi:hypothetical protein